MSEQTTNLLGKLCGPDAKRDAVHVAVVPCVAGMRLQPGSMITMESGTVMQTAIAAKAIGVVDPFLASPVACGERFWLFLKPGTVTGMRHAWQHPAFPDEGVTVVTPEDCQLSKGWLLGFISSLWPYDNPEKILDHYFPEAFEDGDMCFGVTSYDRALTGSEEESNQTLLPEFWTHYERYTRRPKPARTMSFRCAC